MASATGNNQYVLAIFLGNFGLGLMHTTFMFYYVKVFLNIFKVNEFWFNLAQFLFLIWNAINDPLFGYFQDVGATWMKDRAKIFTYFGPLLVISFLLTWFPWRNGDASPPYVEGMHLIISLFLYDAFFSCIGVAWSALYSESTRDHRKRVRGIKYAQLATLLSINVITFAEKISHSLEYFGAFQFICLSVGIMSLICLYLTGQLGSVATIKTKDRLLEEDELVNSEESSSESEKKWTWQGLISITKELICAEDFRCVVFTNFLHICRTTAHINFAAIATDILVPQNILPKGSWQLSAFFAACTLLPQIIVITNDKFLLRKGAYRVFLYGLFVSICSAFLYFLSGNPYVIILFMLIDSVTAHASSPLFNLLLSEVIEDDKTRHARKNPLSSMIFSLNALITKPAISIAPVVIVYLLNRNDYELYKENQIKTEALRLCTSRIIFATPLLLGILELLVFQHYSLRHRYKTSALPI